MYISSYHIQNVIRAYGQRIERRSLSTFKPANVTPGPDSISISSQAKQRQVTEKVAKEIVSRATGRTASSDISRALVDRLESEFGGTLDVLSDKEKDTEFKFRVIDADKGEIIKELSSQHVHEVIEKLYNIIERQATRNGSNTD